MGKKHKPEDFVDAPRPEAMNVDEFQAYLDSIPESTKKQQRKEERKAAKLKAKRVADELAKQEEDKGKKYQIRFSSDTDGFYEHRAVLPAAAFWNFDEFLMAYIATGLDHLLNGHTDWNYWDKSWGKPNKNKGTRKKLKRARDLAQRYVDASLNIKETPKDIEGAHEALRILTEVGVARLWD